MTEWDAFIRGSLFQVLQSGQRETREDNFHFCRDGSHIYTFQQNSTEFGLIAAGDASGTWRLDGVRRTEDGLGDAADITIVLNQASDGSVDPNAPEAQRTTRTSIVLADDGRLFIGQSRATRSPSNRCP